MVGVIPTGRTYIIFRSAKSVLASTAFIMYCGIFVRGCGGYFFEYQIVNGAGEVLSTAQVCPKLPIFTFFKKGYHIGPCMTIKEERGKGYYPLLLQYIIDEHPEKEYYMIVDEHNISSQRGIEKMNFVKFAEGKKDRLGRYVVL